MALRHDSKAVAAIRSCPSPLNPWRVDLAILKKQNQESVVIFKLSKKLQSNNKGKEPNVSD